MASSARSFVVATAHRLRLQQYSIHGLHLLYPVLGTPQIHVQMQFIGLSQRMHAYSRLGVLD